MKKVQDLIFLIDNSLRDLNNETIFLKTITEYDHFKSKNQDFIIVYDEHLKKNKKTF